MTISDLPDRVERGDNGTLGRKHFTGRDPSHWVLAGLTLWFALLFVLRVLHALPLEKDEAEQLVNAQWWLAGYSGQPPLYTWLQIGVFALVGEGVIGLSLLKHLLLWSGHAAFYFAARELLPDRRLAPLALLGLLLIPQIGWEMHRDLTHSVLVFTLASASLWVAARWYATGATHFYLLAGLAVGLGLLSKYNYAIFALALLLAFLSTPNGRRRLFDRRILLTLGIALAIVSPHLLWMLEYREDAASSLADVGMMQTNAALAGLGDLGRAVLSFLSPLWLALLVLSPRGLTRSLSHGLLPGSGFPLGRFMLTALGLLVLMVVFADAAEFKDRWMIPLLFVLPIQFFAFLDAGTPRRLRAFAALTLLVPVAVTLTLLVREGTLNLPGIRPPPRPAFAELARLATANGFDGGLIMTQGTWLAGNLLAAFPGSRALGADANYGSTPCAPLDETLLVWNAVAGAVVPGRLARITGDVLGNVPSGFDPSYLLLLDGERQDMEVALLRLPHGPAVDSPICRHALLPATDVGMERLD
ncbi:MAG: glycosyltransferase family 39 protein [Chromatiales bacterium]|jgi:4-amino-4-deoxy-L-arabinose transferase-like glycosyltransferase|nr:glycosyltransferase family 39 protein [Chromatiales bacterium]MDX9765987.1 glycosyltransferase family 39 protein [Ectothiorhodospiraceae bacterium]